MSDDDNARVNMVWPKELKDRVRDKVGSRGLTEFVTDAVDLHLKGGADALAQLELEINETKNLAQLLADLTAMGGSNVDRLESFMEIELPSWMDTSGWPSEFAKRVRPDAKVRPPDVIEMKPIEEAANLPDPEPDAEGVREPVQQDAVEPQVRPSASPEGSGDEFFERKAGAKDDLFAKVMAATGGDPLMAGLKPASEIPVPEPKTEEELEADIKTLEPTSGKAQVLLDAVGTEASIVEVVQNRCAVCGDELVDGECWTC